MREVGTGSLATLGADGAPFASYVVTASAGDGSPILLLSDLAVHSENLARDPRASLLFVGDTVSSSQSAAHRLTLTGTASKDNNAAARRLFLARHPEATLYASFADFAFYRFEIASGHLVAGFGRIVDLAPAELLDPSVDDS
jgi:hypothetical protein